MKVSTAQYPAGDDRVSLFTSEVGGAVTAAVMLDGASSFVPVAVKTSRYVDVLSHFIGIYLSPGTELRSVLRQAIAATVKELDLVPGRSPSSTVTMVRQAGEEIECLVLGDNLVAFPAGSFIDDRMEQFGKQHRARYQQRLRDGHGWGSGHSQLLRNLQAEQIEHRNKADGYWIAEANPDAADQAFFIQEPVVASPWAVLATDGAYKVMSQLGIDDWGKLTTAEPDDLEQLLRQCQQWESDEDPNGQELPRAKLHDDKSLAVINFQ
jgi:hypothetical protein